MRDSIVIYFFDLRYRYCFCQFRLNFQYLDFIDKGNEILVKFTEFFIDTIKRGFSQYDTAICAGFSLRPNSHFDKISPEKFFTPFFTSCQHGTLNNRKYMRWNCHFSCYRRVKNIQRKYSVLRDTANK
ncbi:hypothetical protein OPIT5_26720 [Opitutaceae bacterium TAV5]|nr:hypothetical protein OPIT5_26720 [Opitutaceae bacterium TAV5]